MASLKYLFGIMFFCRSNGQECSIKDISCAEIKTAEGFNFSHGFSRGSSVTVIRHQILIAYGQLSPPFFNFTADVRSMDSSSIVTATCEDLRIEVTYPGRYISESCVDFRVTDEVKPSDPEGEVTPHLGYIKCSVKNISCAEIKTAEGFNFSHGISRGSRVTAIRNQIPIAHGLLSPPSFNYTPDVRSMDGVSIVTAACEDVIIQVIHHNGRHIRESCVDFRVIDDVMPFDPEGEVTPQLGYISVGPAVVGAVVLIGCLCYIPWKRKEEKNNRVATFPGYLRWLMRCSFLRKSRQEQRPDSVEEGEDGDSASQQHGISDELENGRNDNPPGIPHESVPIPIIDPEAGGGTAHMLPLNHKLSNGEIQPSTNGCIRHSAVTSGSNDQTVNQNVKDDPGGMNDNEGKCGIMHSGRTLGGQSPEGHEKEDEPLLLKPSCQEELYEPPPPPPCCRFEGPTIHISDMTGGEAVVWWTRNGSDPALTSRCSTEPDTDVDSAPDMKQN